MATRLKHLLENYRSLAAHGKPVVMATITETLGSTYQKAGARLLIPQEGDSRGLLSGGCFENDLREQAASVFSNGQVKQLFYDMRSPDDALWGLGLGCNGAVRVLLQRLDPGTGYYPLDRIDTLAVNRQSSVMATVCESELEELPGGYCVFLDPEGSDQCAAGTTAGDALLLPARQTWLEQQPRLHDLRFKGKPVRVFLDIINPPPAILVIGAGPDAVPVTAFAADLGWDVTLVDHRPAYLKKEHFPAAGRLLNHHPAELSANLDLDRFAALVLMTHNIDYDERYLQAIAASSIPYIGLLGPAKRRDRLLDSLGGLAEKIRGRAFGPAGLDLGAETPEEIALSIMAEIQAVMKQRDGQSLALKQLPIQARAAPN